MHGGILHALKFIDKIGVVPLKSSGLLDLLPNELSKFKIFNLEEYKYVKED